MTTHTLLWLVYILAIICGFIGWWMLLRKSWNKLLIFVSYWLLAIPFVVPFGAGASANGSNWLAPALIVAGFETIAGNQVAAADALRPVLLVECIALFIVLLALILRSRRNKMGAERN